MGVDTYLLSSTGGGEACFWRCTKSAAGSRRRRRSTRRPQCRSLPGGRQGPGDQQGCWVVGEDCLSKPLTCALNSKFLGVKGEPVFLGDTKVLTQNLVPSGWRMTSAMSMCHVSRLWVQLILTTLLEAGGIRLRFQRKLRLGEASQLAHAHIAKRVKFGPRSLLIPRMVCGPLHCGWVNTLLVVDFRTPTRSQISRLETRQRLQWTDDQLIATLRPAQFEQHTGPWNPLLLCIAF